MFDSYQICPYTGLRSFTEEESLYFKGREEHIEQATQQLQQNKFLMLTGASGDGKSSLVYAGIVPNARAGFLKAKYTQWHVAEFRPERTPFMNLCKALTRQLNIADPSIVESELKHGFSALVDLYKNSDDYLDTENVIWKQADEGQKAALKRKAANLMIIVDQFEEFFTNPENYHQGVPSRDSNLVLNLLLETARIALDEDLPIYIVFTMRSDYIGQCAAFRSLPEYLGFSQFFVPRLNRVQLQQVIEEPATLSGNRISRRLTERLIHDIAEGVDQLPILQHALNQIWHAASNGAEEMDLIHYAMVSGMPVHELPDDQTDRFNKWFAQLPEEIKKCYHRPDLQNVLDTHANKLYESAEEHYLKKTGKTISDATSKLIIKTAFSCLTKIDQSRAVRNRMTLNEIWLILNHKEVDLETVGQVLNIFREPGNTFIRPFITEDPESSSLGGENVLDITHESLIRNWDLLKTWAKEEYDSYLVSQDFEQQLGRWVESGKSNNFLLSIGPLTYFENWFKRVKPNSWWIARYLPDEEDSGKKKAKAETLVAHANEFLNKSAQKHIITRTVMKLGPKKIAAALAALVILTLSSFAVSGFLKQRNSAILQNIKGQTLELARDPKLGLEFYGNVIAQQLQYGNLSVPELVQSIKDPLQKIHVTVGIGKFLVIQGLDQPAEEILQCFQLADSLLSSPGTFSEDAGSMSALLKEQNNLRVALGFANLHTIQPALIDLAKKNARRSGEWVLKILKNPPETFNEIRELALALEGALHYKTLNQDEIDQLLTILSPFGESNSSAWIKKNFARDILQIRGTQDYGFLANGLFQELAYLYAASGDEQKALWCIDSLLTYNQGYLENDYETGIDNATNIAAVFFSYGHFPAMDSFVNGYCERKKIHPSEFYNRLVSRSLLDNTTANNYNYYSIIGQSYSNLNLRFCSDELISYAYGNLRKSAQSLTNPDEAKLSLAISYKNEAILTDFRSSLRGHPVPVRMTDSLFQLSLGHFNKVSQDFLSGIVSVVNSSAVDRINIPYRNFYLYPDYFVPFHPFEPRSYVFPYNSPAFVDFILRHDLFKELYRSEVDVRPIESWLMFYNATQISKDYFMKEAIPYKALTGLAQHLEKSGLGQRIDLNVLYLHLGIAAMKQGDTANARLHYKNLQPEKVLNAFQYKGMNFLNQYSFEQYAHAIAQLFIGGMDQKALDLIRVFKKPVNRSSLYGFIAQQLLLQKESRELALRLIDSARAEMGKIDNPAIFQPNRHQLAIALMLADPNRNEDAANKIIKNSPGKLEALTRFASAHALNDRLYKALLEIPSDLSDDDRGWFFYRILSGYNHRFERKAAWKKFEDNTVFVDRFFLPYINENE